MAPVATTANALRSLDIPRSPTALALRAARRALVEAGPDIAKHTAHAALMRRGLSVSSDAQKVTLGMIAVYIVVIALLWNIPYVRYILWPFKVRPVTTEIHELGRADHPGRCWLLHSTSSAMPSPAS